MADSSFVLIPFYRTDIRKYLFESVAGCSIHKCTCLVFLVQCSVSRHYTLGRTSTSSVQLSRLVCWRISSSFCRTSNADQNGKSDGFHSLPRLVGLQYSLVHVSDGRSIKITCGKPTRLSFTNICCILGLN